MDENTYEIDDYDLDEVSKLPLLSAEEAYLKEIKNIPIPSKEEIYKLGIKNMQGDLEARNKLVEGHLRFVASIAAKYKLRAKHLSYIDLIQYGSIGLMHSLETFDPNIATLTTYSKSEIERAIKRSIDDLDEEIRKPVHITSAKRKYNAIMSQNMDKNISDEKIKDDLKISSETLKYLKESVGHTITSLNKRIGEDDTEFGDFVELENHDIEDAINQIDEFELFIAIKEILNPFEYFILYFRFLSDRKTLDELGKMCGVTREYIRQKEERVKLKIKKLIDPHSKYRYVLINKIKKREGKLFYKLKKEPIKKENILIYVYLKPYLDETDKKILKEILLGKYNFTNAEISNIIGIPKIEYRYRLKRIQELMNDINKQKQQFLSFAKDLTITYGTRIFNLDLTKEYRTIEYQELASKYNNMSNSEFMELYGDKLSELPFTTQTLLKRFFDIPYMTQQGSRFINTDINILIFNYKYNDYSLSPKKLYETYIDYKDSFTQEEQLYLETFVFNKVSKQDFYKKFPNSKLKHMHSYLVKELEKRYFDLQRFFFGAEFTKERWLNVLNKYPNRFTEDRVIAMNLHLGVNDEPKTIQEIAEIMHTTYKRVHSLLQKSRNLALSLETNSSIKIEFDEKLYKPFLLNLNVPLKLDNRNITIMHVIKKMSYEEISKRVNLTKTQVSNIVTDTIRRIDYYRFGVIEDKHISQMDIDKYFESSNTTYSKEEKALIYDKYCQNMCNDELMEKYSISRKNITYLFARFENSYNRYIVKDIKLTKEDYIEELSRHVCESVLTDLEKYVISYRFGIRNQYNIKGEKLNTKEIAEKLGKSPDVINHSSKDGILKIKLRKIGKKSTLYTYMPRKEIAKLLKDPRLPISAKEKEVICYIYELEGYPYKTLKELNVVFNEPNFDYYRCWQRAYITIQKYVNKEIEGVLNYDLDIAPYLKYFCPIERLFIEEYYKNKTSYENIAKKHNISYNKVITLSRKVKDYLYEIQKNPKQKRFDFDYALTALENPLLPYDGDLGLMTIVFKDLFGFSSKERLSFPEIIEKYNLPISEKELNNGIINLMLSICKLKEGIKKNNRFTKEEVLDYYNRHKDTMTKIQLKQYLKYIKRITSPRLGKVKYYINDSIIYDLIEEKFPNHFDVNNTNRNEVITILHKFGKKINNSVRLSLMRIFSISEREFMSGEELKHVYRVFSYLEKIKNNSEKNLLLIQNKEE